jgi:O-antigen/teichoic acid export membrane protein
MSSRTATLIALRREHAQMLSGSVWLLAAVTVVALGSFVFWLVVAQLAPSQEVGRATALFSATLFICYLTSLGLPIAVSRYSTDRSQGAATLFAWSLALTLASSLAGLTFFAAFAPQSIRDGLAGTPAGSAFVLGFLLVAGCSISSLVDVRLMALRRWSLVFWRSVLVALVRLPFLLWVPAAGGALYIYAVAAGGFAVTGVAFLVPLGQKGWLRLRPLPARARRAARFAGVNYLGQLAVQGPFFAVPFVVLVHVTAVENARFYLSWGVMAIIYAGIQMVGQALLVEGGRGGADDRRQARVALGVGLAVALAATVLSLGVGPVLADLYGPDYGPVATILPVLMAGTIPLAVTTMLLTRERIHEHSRSTIAIAVFFAIAVLAPTTLLTISGGAVGAAWGWAIGNLFAAVGAIGLSRLTQRRGGEQIQAAAAATTPVAPMPE